MFKHENGSIEFHANYITVACIKPLKVFDFGLSIDTMHTSQCRCRRAGPTFNPSPALLTCPLRVRAFRNADFPEWMAPEGQVPMQNRSHRKFCMGSRSNAGGWI